MSVWFAWLLVSATVVKATVGAILSSVSTTAALTPLLPRLSVTEATMLLRAW